MATTWRKWHNRTILLAASGLALLLVVGLGLPIAVAVNASPSALAPGDLDASFGNGGKVSTDFGGDDRGYSVAIQGDGRIVVAGYSTAGGPNNFALARYNTDGSLDASFGAGGKVTTDLGGGTGAGRSVAIQSDGKIVVAGYSFTGGNNDFALARYNADGSLDASFGAGGKVATDFGGTTDNGYSVAIQSDGKIVVAGLSYACCDADFALARYNADGSLDTAFGVGGKVTTDFGGNDYGQSVAIQSDGRIVVAGHSGTGGIYNFALARYNASGSLDASFGAGGKVTTDFGGSDVGLSVAIQGDGKLVMTGAASAGGIYDFAVVRYNADGSLDTAFGAGGKVTTDFGSDDVGYSVAIQSDDRIVVAGFSGAGGIYNFALARYNADGSLDSSFGSGGKVTTDFGGSEDYSYSVAIQGDGRIVVAGQSNAGGTYDFAVTRYLAGDPVGRISYFALGDSIASGHGLMDNYLDPCRQSQLSYAGYVRDELLKRYRDVDFVHLACSGATVTKPAPKTLREASNKWLHNQVDSVLSDPLSSDAVVLVSITIGANEFDFTNAYNFAKRLYSDSDKKFDSWVSDTISNMKDGLKPELERLLARPNIAVVVTEVHNPFNRESVFFRANPIGDRCGLLSIKCYERTENAVHALNSALVDLWIQLGRPARLQIAAVHAEFHGHESPRSALASSACGSADPDVLDTWIQYKDDPQSNSNPPIPNWVAPSPWTGDCIHPNVVGAQKYGEAVNGDALRMDR